MTDKNRYIDKGFKNRDHYLDHLAEYYQVPDDHIQALSDVLGIDEDFDGLVSSLQDYDYLFTSVGISTTCKFY